MFLFCLCYCQHPPHNFAYISQESLSKAMHVAEQDMKRKKDSDQRHSVDIRQYDVSHRTKIVKSPEYVKRLKRRRQRDCRVGCMLYL